MTRFNGHRRDQVPRRGPKASHVTLPDFEINTIQSVPVTFDRPFTTIPAVTVTPHVDDPASVDVSVTDVTQSGFTMHAQRPTGGLGFVVSWQAVEPTQ